MTALYALQSASSSHGGTPAMIRAGIAAKTATIGDAALGRGVRFYLNEVPTKGPISTFGQLTRFFIDIIVTKAVRYFSVAVGALKMPSGVAMSKSAVIANVASTELLLGSMTHVADRSPEMASKILTTSHDGNSIVWVWECSVGSFVWHYAEDETVYIISGEVFISTENGEERRLGQGDMAVFPGGVSCKWRVTAPVKKIAITRKDLPLTVGFGVRACHKLARILGLRGKQTSL
jgi:uncharacterized cupin superfamily protein